MHIKHKPYKKLARGYLEKCFCIWSWMYENDPASKLNAYYTLDLYDDANACPACEYVVNSWHRDTSRESNCKEVCPIAWGINTKGHKIMCNMLGSPYKLWADVASSYFKTDKITGFHILDDDSLYWLRQYILEILILVDTALTELENNQWEE